MNDRHHLLFPRQEWSLRPQAKKLRETPSLVPLIDRREHEYIHREVPIVPLLGYHALFGIHEHFHPRGHTLADIDELASAIEKATKPHWVQPLERDLGGLAIEALLAQKRLLSETWGVHHG